MRLAAMPARDGACDAGHVLVAHKLDVRLTLAPTLQLGHRNHQTSGGLLSDPILVATGHRRTTHKVAL